MLYTHLPLVIKCQSWDLIFAAVSVLNMYVVHDDQLYITGSDTYISCTVHEQDSVLAMHERTNYKCAVATACKLICAYIACD